MPGLRGRPAVTITTSLSGGVGIVGGAVDVRIEALHRTAAEEIEGLALGDAFLVRNVEQNDVTEFLGGRPVGTGRTDVSSADDTDLRASHDLKHLQRLEATTNPGSSGRDRNRPQPGIRNSRLADSGRVGHDTAPALLRSPDADQIRGSHPGVGISGLRPTGSHCNRRLEQPPPMPSATRHPRVIPPRESRRILLAAQGLATPPAARIRPGVGAASDRAPWVRPGRLDQRAGTSPPPHPADSPGVVSPRDPHPLLEKDRSLFEHWTHDASLIPTRWFEHWKPRFARYAERADRNDWWHERLGGDPAPLLKRIHARVRTTGPLRGRDLEDERSEDGGGGWWNWHPGKAASNICGEPADFRSPGEHDSKRSTT